MDGRCNCAHDRERRGSRKRESGGPPDIVDCPRAGFCLRLGAHAGTGRFPNGRIPGF